MALLGIFFLLPLFSLFMWIFYLIFFFVKTAAACWLYIFVALWHGVYLQSWHYLKFKRFFFSIFIFVHKRVFESSGYTSVTYTIP